MDAKEEKQNNRSPEMLRGKMDQPSREAMAGKLQIYADKADQATGTRGESET